MVFLSVVVVDYQWRITHVNVFYRDCVEIAIYMDTTKESSCYPCTRGTPTHAPVPPCISVVFVGCGRSLGRYIDHSQFPIPWRAGGGNNRKFTILRNRGRRRLQLLLLHTFFCGVHIAVDVLGLGTPLFCTTSVAQPWLPAYICEEGHRTGSTQRRRIGFTWGATVDVWFCVRIVSLRQCFHMYFTRNARRGGFNLSSDYFGWERITIQHVTRGTGGLGFRV